MMVKTIVDEDFVNYKKPSMFIGTVSCGGKCCIEANIPLSVCQNDEWRSCTPLNISDSQICMRYLSNSLTSAVIIGGLEPFEQSKELHELISVLRCEFGCDDDVVIYTGYTPEELSDEVEYLSTHYKNIIIKFGRFRPNQESHYDEVLGVNLVSDNQYAVRIS